MDQTQTAAMQQQYAFLKTTLNERHWRLYLASEAKRYGRGGVALVSGLSGAGKNLIRRGLADMTEPPLPDDRIRRSGGGRKKTVDVHPEIGTVVDTLIHEAGDPMKHIVWTHLSIDKLTAQLKERGHVVGKNVVNRLLWQKGYRLKKNQKELHKKSHPDRDAQFRYIDDLADQYLCSGDMQWVHSL